VPHPLVLRRPLHPHHAPPKTPAKLPRLDHTKRPAPVLNPIHPLSISLIYGAWTLSPLATMAPNAAEQENNDHLILSEDPDHPANLIPSLCAKFWTLGWVTRTGGGCSIREE